MADAAPRSRGHLNPGAAGVRFDRFELGTGLSRLVRHVWLVTWSLPDGAVVPQRVLSYPAVNIVFEPSGVALYGPDSRVDTRVLRGAAWAVGVLFRPAAGVLLSRTAPRDLVRMAPEGEPVDGAPFAAVRAQLAESDRVRLIGTLRSWLAPAADEIDARGLLLNRACSIAENDEALMRVDELAASVDVSVRTLERLVRSRLGVSPKWLIECRRMQNAATRLYSERDVDLSALAAELGYVDYAHLSHRYASILHETPDQTRRAGERARTAGSH
ncbi:AraC family transcriptional regulator [Paramicrobacterium chengjingii]|uniref:AraC family transcriptional regulator n=1 Tax=Paramicrobacterium chengjingii TaxID=2769067 RepID=A0ABX6YGD8_9MICO|nr:helix-turn-helix domain-containing protein [Microbacterium chengjingii]QPZ37660.1 AraC family transcriptional regulator [Microbacterium chengjingii]